VTTRQRRRSKLRMLLVPAGSLAVLGYFVYHSFNGDYGIWSRERMEAEAVRLEAELAALQKERTALAFRANLLRPESLDPDMVDERARRNLNVLHPDELMIDLGALQHRNSDRPRAESID